MYIKYWRENLEVAGDDEGFGFREVKTKQCDPERDFNDEDGSNKQSKFFKADPDSMIDLNTYGPKMKCIDDD